MLFGDPHIGKAIALLRAAAYNQTGLASALGIDKSTMNKYEKGTTHVPEEVLRKIAQLINRELIEILDTSYAIFRFNYCRDKARREGTDLEELIARYDSRAAVEEVHAAQASYMEKLHELERKKTELLGREKSNGFTVLRHVVETESGLRKKKPQKPAAKKEPGR